MTKPTLLRSVLLLTCIFSIHTICSSQNKLLTSHAWIKQHVENLSDRLVEEDTIYARYKFDKSKVYVSFNPGWNDYQFNWTLNNKQLTLGFDNYTIEELTDTSLIISLQGFRRVFFLAEDYCNTMEKHLQQKGEYNNKPLYKANRFITPRYSAKESLRIYIDKGIQEYSIPNASYLKITFVVTETGKIENIQVVSSILEGFDNAVIAQLKKTSGKWQPATFKGQTIQTEMYYDIRYLKSIVPYESGRVN